VSLHNGKAREFIYLLPPTVLAAGEETRSRGPVNTDLSSAAAADPL
jgi:hypothetical protein